MPSGTVRNFIEDAMRRRGLSLDEAAADVAGIGVPHGAISTAVEEIRADARKNLLLKVPGGVSGLEYRMLIGEARRALWYGGPGEHSQHWNGLVDRMTAAGLDDLAIDDIDRASTKIVAHLPDPGIKGLTKKGLVVGFVQSGKTANYAAVIAKAADAGYRFFIVMSGIHNNLRAQTQRRLDRDLVEVHADPWVRLTDETRDFGTVTDGPGLLSARELRNLAVVKKNAFRLRRLRDWLTAMPPMVRERCPVLIVDDEADQASPNTLGARDEISTINGLIREIRALLPTGAYVGYTATPFASVLIDPEETDLYPSDFIIDLPRPAGYFGAEQIFGRVALDDADDPFDGFDMVRRITDLEVLSLRPPVGKEKREQWEPELPDSLVEAVKWFLLATAARSVRDQSESHVSMLVHVSQFVVIQFRIGERIRELLAELRRLPAATLSAELRELWLRETGLLPARDLGVEPVAFEDIEPHLDAVLRSVRVVVDNGLSQDRVDYEVTETGADGVERIVPQKIIAVGGNTLSRGLTLEGLTVSYFTRLVQTYDALLQMGRWFGFRPGYQDLIRVWVPDSTKSDFRFLATVEEEIRSDIRAYENEGVTPAQVGLRIRSHPTMAVTAGNKMHNAVDLKVSYGGVRLQTFRFRHKDLDLLARNLNAGRRLVTLARESGIVPTAAGPGRWVLRSVPKQMILEFIRDYEFHPDHRLLNPTALLGYLEGRDDEIAEVWNVAVMGSSVRNHSVDGSDVDLGTLDLGLDDEVPMINRARLVDAGSDDTADIKSLMSRRDRFVDLDVDPSEWGALETEDSLKLLREERSGGRGLLMLYPVSRHSVPMGRARKAGSRVPLDAVEDVLGVGLIFPKAATRDGTETSYVGLAPHLLGEPEVDEEEYGLLAHDDEGDAIVTGDDYLAGLATD